MSAERLHPPDPELDRAARAALSAAVQADDAAQVAVVIEEYPFLQSRLDEPLVPDLAFGATPLLAAVYKGNREMVDVLLRAGADINARSRWWAGGFGVLDARGELAPFLIERGALVDIHAAARLGMFNTVRDLVSSNPELVHARGGDGQTPLHVASTIEIAAYLLEHGADIDARDVDHESTPAQYMVRDRQAIARHLVNRGCRTDILLTAALGDVERVRQHLDRDPSCIRTAVSERYFPKQDSKSGGSIYNWTLGTGKTAHIVAREFGHDAAFELLMSRSPAPLRLAVACELGDEGAVQALLADDPGAVSAFDREDVERIAGAARENSTQAVRLMLIAGWPVDVRGQHGGTPLHWAAWHGNVAMALELVHRGAPLDAVDDDHSGTPLDWALHGSVHGWNCRTGDYAGTVDALLRAGAPLPAPDDSREISSPVREVLRRHAAGPPKSRST